MTAPKTPGHGGDLASCPFTRANRRRATEIEMQADLGFLDRRISHRFDDHSGFAYIGRKISSDTSLRFRQNQRDKPSVWLTADFIEIDCRDRQLLAVTIDDTVRNRRSSRAARRHASVTAFKNPDRNGSTTGGRKYAGDHRAGYRHDAARLRAG